MNIKGLGHVALYTTDIEQTLSFYEKLGGSCYARDQVQKPNGINQLAMMRFPGFDLEIIQPGDGTPVMPEGGLWPHIAIEVEDINTAFAELKNLGIDHFKTEQPVEMPTLFGGLRDLFFYGPNGELIELIEHL